MSAIIVKTSKEQTLAKKYIDKCFQANCNQLVNKELFKQEIL